MKILKYLLFLILILFIAGSIYVATKDGDFKVEATETVSAPASLLYQEVSDFSNWKTWEAWDNQEGINIALEEPTSGEGAIMKWQADEIRDGNIRTISAIPNKQLKQKLIMQTSVGQAEGEITWIFEPEGNQTKVSWTLEGSQNFKEKIAFSLQDRDLVDIFKPVFEKSLENLSQNVIRQMEEFTINVDGVTEHGGGYYMYTTTAAKISDVNAKAAEMIKQVRIYMNENNISINGNPFVIYNQRDEQNNTSIFSAAVPTPSQVITPSGSPVLNGFLEPQKVVKTTLRGNSKNAPEAWEKAYRYIEANGLQVNPLGQPFEIHVTNPGEIDNPALWITEIYIPVE